MTTLTQPQQPQQQQRRSVHVYTDGSCRGNPGTGGWAFLVKEASADVEDMLQGDTMHGSTTNNRAELTAVIEALGALVSYGYDACDVIVHSDSLYVVNVALQKWKCKSNFDLWRKWRWATAVCEAKQMTVTYAWVRGHSGNEWNARVDALAQSKSSVTKTTWTQ